ncbi:MAG: DUF2793 domain-containing protein [Rhodoblastus sp.]|nr:DUF2793 domain-containing protein [Rhodoblastus sp.]
MSNSTRLALPFIDGAQSQKHVTHNEALVALDTLVHLAVKARDIAAPPVAPAEGDRYLVPTGASGAFANYTGAVAAFDDGGWAFLTPRAGWRAYVETEDTFLLFDGATWKDVGLSLRNLQNLSRLGIGATADAANPLLAKLNSALLTARAAGEGGTGDLRVALNKSTAGATVSQLYQTNYSGRAETGLAGDDNFHLKVSADGSLWKEALNVDSASGAVSFPNGLAHDNPGFRNRLINGNFDIWQRGVSFVAPANSSINTADRWKFLPYNTGASATVSRIAAPTGFRGQNAINAQATGVPANGIFAFAQRFESQMVADLDSQSCVVSFDCNASTTAGGLTGGWVLSANTAVDNGTFSVVAGYGSFTLPVGSGVVKIAMTAAQTANLKNGAELKIQFVQTGASGNPNVSIGAVQFEADPSGAGKANPFEFRPLTVELAMCQRYYRRLGGVWQMVGIGITTTTQARVAVVLPVAMRAAPTMTISDQTKFLVRDGVTNYATTTMSLNWSPSAGQTVAEVYANYTGGTTGRSVQLSCASTGEYLEFSAEL